MEDLKAELYTIKAENASLRSELKASEQRTRGGKENSSIDGGDASVKGEQLEKSKEVLAKEIQDLENIVRMYERENARLADTVMQREKEMKSLRSEFFDKQEGLVKEINKLNNKCHSAANSSLFAPGGDSMLTQDFASELERDALVRNMSEQILSLEKSCRKKDSQIAEMAETVNAVGREKIVLERALSRASSGMRLGACDEREDAGGDDVDSLRANITLERKRHSSEIAALNSKLSWYADTQELVESVKAERDRYKNEVEQLRGKVSSAGESSLSMTSSSAGWNSTGGGARQKRNPADVRRIRCDIE